MPDNAPASPVVRKSKFILKHPAVGCQIALLGPLVVGVGDSPSEALRDGIANLRNLIEDANGQIVAWEKIAAEIEAEDAEVPNV